MKIKADVSSSCVNNVSYDTVTEKMTVEYAQGTQYEYSGVPKSVFDELINADSVGRFINTIVKPSYPAMRM